MNSPLAERCSMGVPGLDVVLGGGLPARRLYLIQGDPGVGKTTLAMQFLMEGAKRGEAGLYVTLSETKEEIEVVAESHGRDLSKIHLYELSTIEEQIRGESESTFFHPSEVELNRTISALVAEVEKVKPVRVVFDSLSEMRMLADTPLRYRRQILQIKQFFAGRNSTVLMLDDRTSGTQDLQVESIAHGVICLSSQTPEYGVARRQLSVVKIRGSEFREGSHDLLLRRGGLIVFPRLVAGEHHREFVREDFPSGTKELVGMHGGRIEAQSDGLHCGSTFTVFFPAATKSAAANGKGQRAGADAMGCRVLIVDDNIDTAQGLARLLTRAGHEVTLAHDGHQALEKVREHSPHAIVLDIGLPGMDGFEVVRRLRAEAACANSMVIAVTGYGQPEDRQRAMEAGFDHHLVKPVDLDELKQLLQSSRGAV